MIVYEKEEKQSAMIACYPNLETVYNTLPRDVRLHMKRVSTYAEIIYRNTCRLKPDLVEGLSHEFKVNAKKIFMLHDIGRAYVPVRVLNKAGGLTKEEFELVKQHTVLAKRAIECIYEIPFSSEVMGNLFDTATYHHEKWNGTGYPKGLAGEEIPICARICAVGDAFDGMVSWKPYRNSFSIEKASAIINEEAGKQFQPELVEIFNLSIKEMGKNVEK